MTGARAEPHKQHRQSPDLGDRAKGLEVGGQLLHSLQQARSLGIFPSLNSPLQLVCKESMPVGQHRHSQPAPDQKRLMSASN